VAIEFECVVGVVKKAAENEKRADASACATLSRVAVDCDYIFRVSF
jgi:hypothetical protein